MDTLRVTLFGRMDVQYGGQAATGLDANKVQELFCYLLFYRDRPHPRELLASLLWSEQCAARSKAYLRKTLWQLQASLDAQVQPLANRLLAVTPDSIRLSSTPDLWLDVELFEQAFAQVKGIPGHALSADQIQRLSSAAALYIGDLLEGWYQDWCLYERERLQHIYLSMLDKLTSYCEAHEDFESGIAYSTLILRYDRARECTHRRLMRLHYLDGDRTAALRQYERCVTALREELGVRPSERTVALCEQIRSGRQSGPALKRGPSLVAASLSTEVLDHLRDLHEMLVQAQRQLAHDILSVESALDRHA